MSGFDSYQIMIDGVPSPGIVDLEYSDRRATSKPIERVATFEFPVNFLGSAEATRELFAKLGETGWEGTINVVSGIYFAGQFGSFARTVDGFEASMSGPATVGCSRCHQARRYTSALRAARAFRRWERHVCPRGRRR